MRDIFADTKAVIDIQVTVATVEPDDAYVGARQAAAYVLRDGVTRDHRPLGVLGPDSEWEKRLFGGLPGQRWTNIHVRGADRLEHEATVAVVRTALSDEGFAAAWAAGQAMILEQAVARALADPDRTDAVTTGVLSRSRPSRRYLPLSPLIVSCLCPCLHPVAAVCY